MEDIVKFAVEAGSQFGASYTEARFQKNEGLNLTLKNGVPDPAGFVKKSGIAVRVLVNDALGFACTNNLGRDNVRRTVESAYRTAKQSSRLVKKPVRMAGKTGSKATWGVKPRRPFESVSVEDQFSVLQETEKVLTAQPMPIKLPARVLEVASETEEKYFANSEGTMLHGTVPRARYFLFLTGASEKGVIQRVVQKGQSGGWEVVDDWNLPKASLDEANKMGEILTKGENPPTDKVDLVLGSEVTGIICHESCGHPQEADRILGREAAQAGESYIKPDMIGYEIGSEQVTVSDDPTLAKSYGYYEYDDEGVKAGKRVLINRGKIASFLHNRETAAELNTLSNASSRAVFFDREPIVRMANTYMEPGDYTFDELVEDIQHGVQIKTFMEWNIDDRRYNQRYVGHEAYLIEKGEVKGLVRNPTIELTTPTLYGSVDAVGKQMEYDAATCGKGDPAQGAPVYTGGPSIRLRNIRLGGGTTA